MLVHFSTFRRKLQQQFHVEKTRRSGLTGEESSSSNHRTVENWSKYLLKLIDLPQKQTKVEKEIHSNTLEAFFHSTTESTPKMYLSFCITHITQANQKRRKLIFRNKFPSPPWTFLPFRWNSFNRRKQKTQKMMEKLEPFCEVNEIVNNLDDKIWHDTDSTKVENLSPIIFILMKMPEIESKSEKTKTISWQLFCGSDNVIEMMLGNLIAGNSRSKGSRKISS